MVAVDGRWAPASSSCDPQPVDRPASYSPSIRAGTKLLPGPLLQWQRFPPDPSGEVTQPVWCEPEKARVSFPGTLRLSSFRLLEFFRLGLPCCLLSLRTDFNLRFVVLFLFEVIKNNDTSPHSNQPRLFVTGLFTATS